MIRINESIPVKSRDNTPVSSGLYLHYKSITLSKDVANDAWFLDVKIIPFESLAYAEKVAFNQVNSIDVDEDKVKTTYHYELTNSEVKNNSALKLADDNIKAELEENFLPSKIIII